MGDRQVVRLQYCVQSPSTTVTTVALQQVEEIHPAKECLVSGLDKNVTILCIGILDLRCQNELDIL
jgi:hypothetical protein